MLLYLTGTTWEHHDLTQEVETFLDRDKQAVILAHEMPGIGQCQHNAVPFDCFTGEKRFPNESYVETPAELLPPKRPPEKSVYHRTAVSLLGDEWRETSMALLVQDVANFHAQVTGENRCCVAFLSGFSGDPAATSSQSVSHSPDNMQPRSVPHVSSPSLEAGHASGQDAMMNLSERLRARLLERWRPRRARPCPRPKEPAQLLISGGLPTTYQGHIGMDDGESAPAQELTQYAL